MDELEKLLPRFGLNAFRLGQRTVIEAVLQGRDTLCIMPTGGGKSLCYQLPSLARPGVTIVVSPLIALMKDQVDSLAACGIPATCINSSLTATEQASRMEGLERGEYRLLYVAPERLRHSGFLRAIQNVPVQMLAIDEAHCISQWGHDFRPDYARLGKFRQRLGNPQVVALTATATAIVQQDICTVLELREPARFVSGFSRPNLSLAVETPGGNAARDKRLIEFLNEAVGGGIIYASTRKNCEHVVELVARLTKLRPEFYHAGMPHDDRRRVQENFMSGKTRVVVATNAFGMGIDKSNLRFVIHYNLPGSLEAYYQEAGRAGRDGLPSRCLMLYSWQDRFIQEFFIENSYPSREIVRQVYEFLASFEEEPVEITLQDIKDQLSLSIGTQGIANCENLLEKAGAIERLDSQRNTAAVRIDSQLPTLVDLLPRGAKARRRVMQAVERLVGQLRGETILFDPRRLTERLDMKWDNIQDALRQFRAIPGFEYVPPFRGRAIHVRVRGQKFSDLEIDFAELERRKKAEFERLDLMIRFATTGRCRQLEILEYFGETATQSCGRCDRCEPALFNSSAWRTGSIANAWPGNAGLEPTGTAGLADGGIGNSNPESAKRTKSSRAKLDEHAILYAVQVALSGVARTHGRSGKLLVAEMLAGSQSKKLVRGGLKKLSTFGLLKPLKKAGVIDLLDWLISQGFISQYEETRFRPLIKLSPTGNQLMRRQLEFDLVGRMPEVLAKALSANFAGKRPAGFDKPPLVESTESGSANRNHVPNSAGSEPEAGEELDAQGLASHPSLNAPRTPGEMFIARSGNTTRPGSGTSRIEIPDPGIQPGNTESGPPATGNVLPNSPHETSSIDPGYYWTWHLLQNGFAVAEVMAIRRLSQTEVIEHLIRAAENGMKVSPGWLLSEEQMDSLDQQNQKANRGRKLRADEPEAAELLLARFLRACRATSQQATQP